VKERRRIMVRRKTYKDYDYHYSILDDPDYPNGNPNRRYKRYSKGDKRKAKQDKRKLETAGAERVLLTKNKDGFLLSWARNKRSDAGKKEYRFLERIRKSNW